MQVIFLGTGTSAGVPMIACKCATCTSAHPHDKRTRTALYLKTDNGQHLIIDAGPDFRHQLLRENIQELDAILLTHSHKDHTAGLDDIRAFNFKYQKAIDIYATIFSQSVLKLEFHYVFAPVKYVGIPEMNLITYDNAPFFVGNDKIVPIEVLHYKMQVFGFRINDFSYITDANFITEAEKAKLQGTKILVVNALRHQPHPSHFNLEQALQLVAEIQPEQAYFTHISHQLGLHHSVQATLPPNVFLAYDGLQLHF
jgi:phosphoribosyl 1,2-cyclic phosphate phosphodiesterase